MVRLNTLDSCGLCGSTEIDAIDPECNIWGCGSCGYVFDNPRPVPAELIRFYSAPTRYDSWLVGEHQRDALWKRRLRKMERTRKPGTLLDIGTGIGQFLHHARVHYTAVWGTEVSESAVEIAKERYSLDVIRGDIEDIGFDDTAFDNITLFHVLEHVPNPRGLIETCRSLLSERGVLVIAVPNDILSLKARLKVLLKRLGVRRFRSVGRLGLPKIALDGSLAEIHLSHFTPEVLRGLLEKCGFCVAEDSLDPYYVSGGLGAVFHHVYYAAHSLLRCILRRNVYDTIWMVGRKK